MDKRLLQIIEQVYLLKIPDDSYAIILPEPIRLEIVVAAWSYALRYSAKGLDVPDYEAALKLMLKRHPSWQVIKARGHGVEYIKDLADSDKADE